MFIVLYFRQMQTIFYLKFIASELYMHIYIQNILCKMGATDNKIRMLRFIMFVRVVVSVKRTECVV